MSETKAPYYPEVTLLTEPAPKPEPIPTLLAELSPAGNSVRAWCDSCQDWHTHGAIPVGEPGHWRAAHCHYHRPDMPRSERLSGYFVHVVGPAGSLAVPEPKRRGEGRAGV